MAVLPLLQVVAGVALLALGGEALVRGAIALARQVRVPPAVIGLTIVAMGTSLPELSVSVLAALRGSPDVAVGNVVGSNIFNIAVILGITALAFPIAVHSTAVRLEWPFMFVASFVALLLARDGRIDRLEGGFLLVSLVLFNIYSVRMARREVPAQESRGFEQEELELTRPVRRSGPAVDVVLILAGLLLLVAGGRVLVDGAIALARLAGVSERIVGLTMVAGGTSLPELAASVAAAVRRHGGVALANVIGSNLFNILGILGVTALIRPVPVAPGIVGYDMWWMLGFSLLLFPLMYARRRMGRVEGLIFLAAYAGYLAFLFT